MTDARAFSDKVLDKGQGSEFEVEVKRTRVKEEEKGCEEGQQRGLGSPRDSLLVQFCWQHLSEECKDSGVRPCPHRDPGQRRISPLLLFHLAHEDE